jgi:hypothetical protein
MEELIANLMRVTGMSPLQAAAFLKDCTEEDYALLLDVGTVQACLDAKANRPPPVKKSRGIVAPTLSAGEPTGTSSATDVSEASAADEENE